VTTENLAMLATGQIIAAGMFALGVLVGTSLSRKESQDDNGNEGTKGKGRWHQPVGTGTQGGIERRVGSGADSRH
jgi:acyl dehydratase